MLKGRDHNQTSSSGIDKDYLNVFTGILTIIQIFNGKILTVEILFSRYEIPFPTYRKKYGDKVRITKTNEKIIEKLDILINKINELFEEMKTKNELISENMSEIEELTNRGIALIRGN